ncbi:MAG: hypothetical protein ABI691_15580 [Ginsengibacter sp.]
MKSFINNVLIWSEVWALLVPVYCMWPVKKQPVYLKPVYIYIVAALLLNVVANVISNQRALGITLPWHNNILVYNLHSVIRFGCFSLFFILAKQKYYSTLTRIIPFLYIGILLLNFTLLDKFFDPLHINGNLMTAETYLLLVYCLLYYLSRLKEDGPLFSNDADFWIVTGLSIYIVINFFVFLFYIPIMNENRAFADKIWTVHNAGYILLCLFIAKGFYAAKTSENLSGT